MDDPKDLSNSGKITKLTHTPEAGFTDIKPAQVIRESYKELATYALGFIALALFIYLIIESLKIKRKVKLGPQKPPYQLFSERLDRLHIDQLKKFELREFCESLKFALLDYLTSLLYVQLHPLTAKQLKDALIKSFRISLPNVPEQKASEVINSMTSLFYSLETGEYGDSLSLQELDSLKESFHSKTKDLGRFFMEESTLEQKRRKSTPRKRKSN